VTFGRVRNAVARLREQVVIPAFSRSRPLRALLTPEQRLRLCRRLIRDGEIGAAVMQLSELLDVRHLRAEIDRLIAQCGVVRAMNREARRQSRFASGRDFHIVPAGSTVTAIIFCAIGDRNVFVDFTSQYFLYQRINAIYVFDASNVFYFLGVRGLGRDVPETAARLRQLAGQLGTERLICFGISAGGYGALRYAPDLGADGVMAMSPVVVPVLEGPSRARIEEAVGRPLDPAELDLARLFRARSRVPLTKIVYGEENAGDVTSARHMSGIPGVSLHGLPGVEDHNSFLQLALAGRFLPLLQEFVEEVRNRPA
jgi:hypothetical protein